MSKEELLKHLIAEIDLIMHDKDYRFENANGTWYSRESCRDLTNEEVFEELRTELRQLADIEAELAEMQNEKAIRELEKVKWFLVEKIEEKQSCFDSGNYNDFADGVKTICELILISIDNQIIELRGGENE